MHMYFCSCCENLNRLSQLRLLHCNQFFISNCSIPFHNKFLKHTKTMCFLARKEFVAPIAAICHLLISTTSSKFQDVIRPYSSLKLKRKIEVITTVCHKWTHTTGARCLSASRLYLLLKCLLPVLKYVHTDQPFNTLTCQVYHYKVGASNTQGTDDKICLLHKWMCQTYHNGC